MNSTRLSVACCVYTMMFIVVIIALDAYLSHQWIIDALSIDEDYIDSQGAGKIGFEIVFCMSLLVSSAFVWCTAKFAGGLIRSADLQDAIGPRARLKLVLIWFAFFMLYLVVVVVLGFCLPEAWLHRLFMEGKGMSCDDVVWDEIFMSLVLALALPISGVIMSQVSFVLLKQSSERKAFDNSNSS